MKKSFHIIVQSSFSNTLINGIDGSYFSARFMNPDSLKEKKPSFPTIIWSNNSIPTRLPACISLWVVKESISEGVASPEGWLWMAMNADAPSKSSRIKISLGLQKQLLFVPCAIWKTPMGLLFWLTAVTNKCSSALLWRL